MSGAIFSANFSLVCLLGLTAPDPTAIPSTPTDPHSTDSIGAAENPGGEETAAPSAVSGEVLPVPAPTAAPPPAPEPAPIAPEPAPEPAEVRPPSPPAKPRPKWWGPTPRPTLTGFGGPATHLTGLNRKFAMMVGFGIGLTIKQRVSIGGMVMWLLNPGDAGTTMLGAKQRLNANYGGLLLDVRLVRAGRLDLSLAGLLGGGGACLQNPEKGTCYDRTAFFLGQPSLTAHVFLLPVLRLVFAMGYRFVVAKAWSGPSGQQLGAPVGTVMLELGWF